MHRNSSSRLLCVTLAVETDFLLARQRAKQIAHILGFDGQDQTRIATAVSEIARNAFEYAAGGTVEFYLDRDDRPSFRIIVTDKGRGIKNLEDIWDGTFVSASGMGVGIAGSRRLLDDLKIESSDTGTTVVMLKYLPRGRPVPAQKIIADHLAALGPQDASSALHAQNHEMMRLLNELRERERELSQLNQELKETNRGVMVLYAELEDRAQELQQASEMKSRFISGVTHELRTPLNSIVSLAGLLIRRIDGELSAEQEKQVLFIQRSAQNLTEMVNDLLDLAKIEAGKVTPRPSEFTIAEFFAALRGMFRPLAMNENVQLIIEDSPIVSTRLYTDEGKLAQILRNFISNALKFTERGTVHVRANLTRDGGVRFSVRDTGIGIAPEHAELVWQEWGQVESDQRPRHKGSGLGLPLSRQLAGLLGGKTWLESTLGEGSTFYVEIPTAVKSSTVRPEPVKSEATMLIIDDDEVSRYILRRTLVTLTSAKLLEASSLVEARRCLATYHPSVIFLDIVMPEENGLAFAEELGENEDTAELPIVLVSSKVLTPEEEAYIQRRSLVYINKDHGDAEDQRVALERVLLNLGMSDLHESREAH
ncbi:MAG TPA: ATP-binding protein [Acidobacteriaceae bacterium]|nr:ATP-binding protein [Acidobacteriaceae bacterium]